MRYYKIKVCTVCGVEYQSTNYQQKFCPECAIKITKDRIKRWNAEHREHKRSLEKIWELKHSDRHRLQNERDPESRRIVNGKHRNRRRALGFIPYNSWFVGCEAHHTDPEHITFIPKPMHRSIIHDVRTGHNMDEINTLTKRWLEVYRESLS